MVIFKGEQRENTTLPYYLENSEFFFPMETMGSLGSHPTSVGKQFMVRLGQVSTSCTGGKPQKKPTATPPKTNKCHLFKGPSWRGKSSSNHYFFPANMFVFGGVWQNYKGSTSFDLSLLRLQTQKTKHSSKLTWHNQGKYPSFKVTYPLLYLWKYTITIKVIQWHTHVSLLSKW